jgi:predicted Zn-dependent peptidase
MREELGICYYINSSNGPSTDHGEFVIFSGVDPKRADVAVKAICDELKKLKEELVGDEELKRVKSSMIAVSNMGLESSDDVAGYFAGRSIFYHDLKTPKQIEKEIKAVTSKQVKKLAEHIFNNKDLTLAVIGKNLKKDKFSKVLNLE